MIDVKRFCQCLEEHGIDFFAGVPDSLLSSFCACAGEKFGDRFLITANEGNAVAAAAGHYMASGRPAAVFMQNSGIGNGVNPLLSLADPKVYNIPMLLIIGWRGEPNVKDEPQHITQGELTIPLLETMQIENRVLSENFSKDISDCAEQMKMGKIVALIVKKGTFSDYKLSIPQSCYTLTREQALEVITANLGKNDIVVSTTGKTSRELFELRERSGLGHSNDFLTVGSMGHTSSVALGISLSVNRDVYCIDGDGSFIMHMGANAVNSQFAGDNFKYIVINNGAHESVGGQPTVGQKIDVEMILRGCGFAEVYHAEAAEDISRGIENMRKIGKSAMVIYVRQGSRKDLGRPTLTPVENRDLLMEELKK